MTCGAHVTIVLLIGVAVEPAIQMRKNTLVYKYMHHKTKAARITFLKNRFSIWWIHAGVHAFAGISIGEIMLRHAARSELHTLPVWSGVPSALIHEN